MNINKSQDQAILYNIQNLIIFIAQMLMNIEGHKMGLATDEDYIEWLSTTKKLLEKVIEEG